MTQTKQLTHTSGCIIANSFDYFRSWECTVVMTNSNFPLKARLFDLVIINEVSQCSLAIGGIRTN